MPRLSGNGRSARDNVHHPLFARFYTRLSVLAEQQGETAAHRTELLSGLSGRVVEIGAGNGLNFTHYPPGVTHVAAVEPEPRLRRLAVAAGRRAAVPVEVMPGTAEELPLEDGRFDAAVASLVLCSVRDLPRALAELRRVLRPGGELRFYEHGRAGRPAADRVQRALDRTVWPVLFGGCHTGRDTLAEIAAAGFEIGPHRRLRVPGQGLPLPCSPHVLGVARRPG